VCWRVLRVVVLLASLVTFGLTTAGPTQVVEAVGVEVDATGHESTRTDPRPVERRTTARPMGSLDGTAAVALVRPAGDAPQPLVSVRPDGGPPRGPPAVA